MLYVHDSGDRVVPMTNDDVIKDGIIIEIVLKGKGSLSMFVVAV